MACGLPVIMTTSAGCARDMIVPGENGFIVASGNVDQLYSSMKDIILNDDLAERMGRTSLEILKDKFSWDKALSGFFPAIEYASKKI